jgi:uroporphyrinogen III methyltransferase/synthase
VKIAAVGQATAQRLRGHGVQADLVPGEAVGETMAEAMIARNVAGQRILLLRADIARDDLPRLLGEAGAQCDDLPVYRTVCPAALPESFIARLEQGELDWITLTSPSAFQNLLALLGPQRAALLRGAKLASIGPVTTRAVREAGWMESAEAQPHDAEGLVQAITRASGTR